MESELTPADIDKLLECHITRPAPADATVTTKLRRTAEPHKNRARIILWPKKGNTDINTRLGYNCEEHFRTTEQVIKQVRPGSVAFLDDLTISFYQVGLSAEGQQRYIFQYNIVANNITSALCPWVVAPRPS